MYSKICIRFLWLISFGAVVFGDSLTSEHEEIDYCSIGLNDTLDGRAYTVEHYSKEQLSQIKYPFDDFLRSHAIRTLFRDTFGDHAGDVLNNLDWYYSFNAERRVNFNNILKESLHCIYLSARNTPDSEKYTSTKYDAESIERYVIFNLLANFKLEEPSYAPMPKIYFSNDLNKQFTCNFAKGAYNDEEYYVAVCASTGEEFDHERGRIIKKGSKKSVYVF